MKQYIKSISVLLSGLIFFHCFSTIQVYLSNLDLLRILSSVGEAGYLLMPNRFIMERLPGIGVAFSGAVFFTLSVGTLTVLVSFLAALLYFQLDKAKNHKAKKYLLIVITLSVALIIITVNLNGICLVETAAFLFVPLFVFFLYRAMFGNQSQRPEIAVLANHFFPLIIFAGCLVFSTISAPDTIFSEFRDQFLMSNKAGMKINDFYYKYTLYPARVFKPYSQRIPKICAIEAKKRTPGVKLIEKRLIQNDYLVVEQSKATDFILKKDKIDLMLLYKGKTIIKTTASDFTTNPAKFLKKFSKKIDKYRFYRRITSLSLKTGFPLFFYILMHFIFFAFLSLFFRLPGKKISPLPGQKTKVALFASLSCLAVGSLAFVCIFFAKSHDVNKKNLSAMLNSGDIGEKIAGLKFVSENQLDLSKYAKYQLSSSENNILEKYWFARGLGKSSDPLSYDILISLLDDPHPNVACQAFYGLGKKFYRNGKKGGEKAIKEIIKRIETSKDWYVQWYAYQALKRLRWKQKKSN